MAASTRFALAIAFLASANAFALSLRPSISSRASPLFIDGPEDGTTITSARKELSYDASTGRFFETDLDPEDCVPNDEYCVIDKDSGELIRLTIEEKERIFLDALQVSWCWKDLLTRIVLLIRLFSVLLL